MRVRGAIDEDSILAVYELKYFRKKQILPQGRR